MLIFLVIALLLSNIVFFRKMKTAEAESLDAKATSELYKSFEKYRAIADVESEISTLRAKSDSEINLALDAAKSTLKEAKSEATLIRERAEKSVEPTRLKADQLLAFAENRSKKILEDANQAATKIAGDALEAARNAETLQKTALAMKNIIDGYGDKYLMPTSTLLDQIAEQFSFDQVGIAFKKAREHVKWMISEERAASCLYAEEMRKQTAINFVLDAFNGKVDTILANAKQDNFGTLKQKIQDAFQTVNHNGKAFRDARITDEYLYARIDELKWSCAIHALKERDKEEQRAIREKIREEEKAAKEIEKALKEAQKNEQDISRNINKVKAELENANEKQRLKYEAKLNELQERLKEAEENGKRAQSMAEKTSRGHVYVISNVGSFGENVLKIGMTRRLEPQDRIDELGDASVPFEFDVHAMIFAENAPALEHQLHNKFRTHQVNKMNARKEFFSLSVTEVRKAIDELGITAVWTLTAEAREYRESIKLVSQADEEKAA